MLEATSCAPSAARSPPGDAVSTSIPMIAAAACSLCFGAPSTASLTEAGAARAQLVGSCVSRGSPPRATASSWESTATKSRRQSASPRSCSGSQARSTTSCSAGVLQAATPPSELAAGAASKVVAPAVLRSAGGGLHPDPTPSSSASNSASSAASSSSRALLSSSGSYVAGGSCPDGGRTWSTSSRQIPSSMRAARRCAHL
mmetsp:Transcript_68592/g.216988  ORF Transcript_68592/g.216988 Transcript_68592/m.216988 type:complete len:201 (-) Transcript_68592:866-1468(-)